MSSASSTADAWEADPKKERRATWLELFFDLVFAAAVAEVSGLLGERYDAVGLLRFALPFFLVWWAWAGHTFFATRFDSDDLGQRLLTVGQMFLVAVMAANTEADPASREAGGFAAAYAAMRALLAIQYWRVRHPASARFRRAYAGGIAVAAALWLASSLVPSPARIVLWAVALAVDLVTPVAARGAGSDHPPDPAHLPERFGLFTLIMMGEAIAGIMAGMKHQEAWTAAAAGSAVLGLGTTFALWWAYFDTTRAAAPRPVDPARRRRLYRWLATHLPLSLGLVVMAVGIEHVVGDGGAHPLEPGGAWLLCGAVALVALSLGSIGSTHASDPPLPAWRVRIWFPVASAIGATALLAPRLGAVWILAGLFGAALAALLLSAGRVRPPAVG